MARRGGDLRPTLLALLLPLLLLLGALASVAAVAAAAGAPKTVTYKLQHSLGLSRPFTDRGAVQVIVEENGALRAVDVAAAASSASSNEGGVALTEAELAAAASSMRDADQGWYRIRAVGPSSGKESDTVVMTGVPMCDVVRAGLRENITLMLDGQTGHLISLEYTPRMSRLSPKSCQGLKPLEPGARFATSVNVAVEEEGKSIPVQAPAVARPPGIAIRFDEAGADRPPPEKSFLQKYWIFIVLAFLLLNSGGPMPEEEEGQRAAARAAAGGQQGRPQGAQGGGAAGAGGGAGGRARQRRT